MAAEIDCSGLVKNTRRMVQEMQEKRLDDCSTAVDAATLTLQLQELAKNKQDVKDKFHKTLTINSFMQNLVKPREQWDAIVTQNEEELQAARSTLKEAQRRTEEQKTKTEKLNDVIVETLPLYQAKLKSLEERLQCLEELQGELQALQDRVNSTDSDDQALAQEVQAQLAKCSADTQACRRELLRMEHRKAQMELLVSRMEETLQQLSMTVDEDQQAMDTRCLLRLQKSINDMDTLSGVTCHVPKADTIVVHFPPNQSAPPSTSHGDDLVLQVTLTFKENSLGSLCLKDVQSNVESFDLDDLWKGQGKGGVDSVPALIHAMKLRWLSHVPLLSEVNCLRGRYAIDWIQQESVLRVIVGRGGSIVCSLLIPSGYPHQGQVTLTSIMGATDSVALEDLKPSTGGMLEDWVCFLENKFGKL